LSVVEPPVPASLRHNEKWHEIPNPPCAPALWDDRYRPNPHHHNHPRPDRGYNHPHVDIEDRRSLAQRRSGGTGQRHAGIGSEGGRKRRNQGIRPARDPTFLRPSPFGRAAAGNARGLQLQFSCAVGSVIRHVAETRTASPPVVGRRNRPRTGWPKRDRLRRQSTSARCCATCRGRAGAVAAIGRTRRAL